MNTPTLSSRAKLSLAIAAVSLSVIFSTPAANVYFIGTNGQSATTNWSDTANWLTINTQTHTSPANNEANFNYNTGVSSAGLITLNVDGPYPGQNTSGMNSGSPQAWGMYFTQTNGYQNVFVQPGILWALQTAAAGSGGSPGGGNLAIDPGATNNGTSSSGNSPSTTYSNYVTFTGIGGTFYANTTTMRIEGQSGIVANHYTIWDMSGLGTYIFTNTAGTAQNFYCVDGTTRSHVLIYLAHTNFITLNAGLMHIGNLSSSSSNSLPIGMYLGMSNYIITGSSSSNLLIGGLGCSNGFLKFNPAFLGGPTAPTAYISGLNGNQNAAICSPVGGAYAGAAVADFTGGNVTWIGTNLTIAASGAAATPITANGTLTFDNGLVNFNTVVVGSQSVSSGAVAVGTINVNTNVTYLANGNLMVNSLLTLGAATGSVTAGTSGTINLSGGALTANSIVGGGGAANVNMTNGTWNVALSSTNTTNMVISSFNANGSTNIINITSVSPLVLTPLVLQGQPVRFHLIAASSRSGLNTVGLAPMAGGMVGHLDTTTTPGVIDFVVTAAPNAPRVLTWTGTNASGTPDGDWDIASTTDWQTNGIATFYNQGDVGIFNDILSPALSTVNLTTTLSPFEVLMSNNATAYTFTGGGALTGATFLYMAGSGTLVLDNSSPNTFTTGIFIYNGTLQLGAGDSGGSLPTTGNIVDNSVLAIDRTDSLTVGNAISGSGSVIEEGGGTLRLTGASSFTGNAVATNASTLQSGNASGFGGGPGTVLIASGSTFDGDGIGITKSITVSGTGVGGNGAIINSSATVGDSSGGLTPMLILTGDATFNYTARWDLGSSTGAVLTNNSLGSSLTLVGGGLNTYYFEWRDVRTDPALNNISVIGGSLGIAGSTTLGNPAGTLNIASAAGLKFYSDDGFNVSVNKLIVLNDGGLIQNGGGANTMNGELVITNSNGSQNCQMLVGGTSLNVAGTVSGNGILYMLGSTAPLTISGDASAFTGGALIPNPAYFIVNNTFGAGVTNQAGGTLAGTGPVNGFVDCSGPFFPGGSNAVGTFTAAGGLTLESSSVMTLDLSGNNSTGGTKNDLVAVTGNLNLNNNTVNINPVNGVLADGAYVIMTYTGGALSGTLGTVQTTVNSRYTFTVDTSVTGQVRLVVSGTGANLVWNNGSANGQWDVQSSQNWTNLTSSTEDVFTDFDFVTFDDTILTAAHPTTTVTIPTGVAVIPGVMTNSSSSANYTITGAGRISGAASIVKLGTSTLALNTTNDFTGTVTILGGTVAVGNSAALGSANGATIITNGGTLNINGINLGTEPVYASGTGVGGGGAIVNNGAQQFSALRSVYMTGDTTFGGPGGATPWVIPGPTGGSNRWDIRAASLSVTDAFTFLSTGGQNYKLTKTGSNQMSFVSAAVDSNLGDIDIVGGNLSFQFLSTMGNPGNTCTIEPNGLLDFYSCSSVMNKKVVFNGSGATVYNENNTNTMVGPITLNGSNIFWISNTWLALGSNAVGGTGSLNKFGPGVLYDADTNLFTGDTLVATGQLSLLGVNPPSLASVHVIVNAGATLDLSLAAPQSLTLSSGQFLEGSGTINGAVTIASGATIVPGLSNNIGTLTITNGVTLAGTTVVDINASTMASDLISATGAINYGGVLNVSTLAGTLALNNSFKLFNSSTAAYTGSFTSITPSPGVGLAWGTSLLNTSGTLTVIPQPLPATFGPSTLSGTTLTLTGSGGANNGTYRIYSSTNVIPANPLSAWTLVGTNSFTGSGTFTFPITISPATPATFYMIVAP